FEEHRAVLAVPARTTYVGEDAGFRSGLPPRNHSPWPAARHPYELPAASPSLSTSPISGSKHMDVRNLRRAADMPEHDRVTP
ncbi:hypothetical protein, partial [Kitasatospora sp. NPDC088351]|uniref:hypothetical protein n=1 Tax=Kitasatospora sp. NPDC088351 TaxID=3155180 RepID=UPI00344896C5